MQKEVMIQLDVSEDIHKLKKWNNSKNGKKKVGVKQIPNEKTNNFFK